MLTPSLRYRLKDPNPNVRESAAMELIFAPDSEMLPDLLALIGDTDTDVRRTALQAIGALNAPEALDGLCQALLDQVPEVSEAALGALVKLGPLSLQALTQWIEHPEWPQRAAAARGLSQMGVDPQLLVPLAQDSIWEVRGEAYLALGRMGALQALRQTSTPMVMSTLRQALINEQQPLARETLLAGLGAIQHPDACQLLLDMLLDPLTEESLQDVATALQAYGNVIHAPLLAAGIWSPIPEVRALSSALLAQTHCPDLKSHLAPLLLDPQPFVRQTAAYAIYDSHPSQPIWEFVAGLYHPDDHEFEAALIELLAYPGAGAGERLLEALDVQHSQLRSSQIIRALGELKYDAAAHVLVELLNPEADPQLLESLCWSLGQLGAWRAWHHLQRLLGHANEGVRRTAVEALILIDPETSCWERLKHLSQLEGQPLKDLLTELAGYSDLWGLLRLELFQHADPAFRGAVLEAFKAYPAQTLRPLLEEFLHIWPQPQAETLDALLEALDQVGLSENLARCLLPWLESRDASIRSRSSRLLRPWADTLKEELLAATLHDIWFVRQAALQTLSSLTDEAVTAVMREALEDRDRDVRITAITLLSEMEGVEMREPLLEALENGARDIRAAAAQALSRLRASWARKPLTTALSEDEAAEVRLAAAQALGEMGLQDPKLAQPIFEILEETFDEDDDPDVQAACLTGMFRLDRDQSRYLVAKALKDEDDALRGCALRLYAEAGWAIDPIAHTLEKLIQIGPETQQALALALLLPLRPDLLMKWLQSADEPLRLACLQVINPSQAVEHQIALALLLEDPSPRIRQQTLRVLAQVPELRPVLAMRARKETDVSVLQILVELLADLPASEVLPVYQEILERPTPQVHTSVIWALAPVMAHGGSQLLQATLPQAGRELRDQIFEVLCSSELIGLEVLTELADHWELDLVLRATRGLGLMGEKAVPVLEEIWRRDELGQQLAVLAACQKLQSPQTLPMLKMAAKSTHNNLRAHAVEAMVKLGGIAREALIELLQDHDARIRFDACLALATIEPENPLWRHLKGISSALPSRRLRHLLALQNLPTSDWLRFAGHLRKDPAYTVRRHFCDTQTDEAAFRRWLLRALQTEILPVRQQAALAMARHPDADTQLQLMACWPKAPPTFREILLAALASLGLSGQARQGLEDSSALVRISAACIAGANQLSMAFEMLLELLRSDPRWEVRAACAWALGCLGRSEAVPVIDYALYDGHPAVLYQSIIALGKIDSPEAGELLVQLLLRQEWDVLLREEVLRAVTKRRLTEAASPLLQIFNQEVDLQLRRRMLDALAQIGTPKAMGFLRELADYGTDRLARHAQKLLGG